MGGKVKNYILSYNLGSFCKRFVVLVLALVLMNFGIACYYQCGLGTDPFSVFVDGEHSLFRLSYGQVTNINNIFLFAFMLIFTRKYIHIGTVVGALISGALIDLFDLLLGKLFPEPVLGVQIGLLIVGLFAFAAGVAFYMIADLGLSGVEAIPLLLEEKTKINLRWLRIAEDLFFMIIGIVLGYFAGRQILGDLVGIGTILGAFGTGPIMKWLLNISQKAFEGWFGPLRKTVKG